jgi:hypothetical protein
VRAALLSLTDCYLKYSGFFSNVIDIYYDSVNVSMLAGLLYGHVYNQEIAWKKNIK